MERETNNSPTRAQGLANKALAFALFGLGIAIAKIYISFGGVLDLLLTLVPIFLEVLALRYASKARFEIDIDSTSVNKTKWARGIAYVYLGLILFGIVAMPYVLLIDVNTVASLIVGTVVLLTIGGVLIYTKKHVWSQNKMIWVASRFVGLAILSTAYFAWLAPEKSVDFMSDELLK